MIGARNQRLTVVCNLTHQGSSHGETGSKLRPRRKPDFRLRSAPHVSVIPQCGDTGSPHECRRPPRKTCRQASSQVPLDGCSQNVKKIRDEALPQQTRIFDTGSLQESSTNCHLQSAGDDYVQPDKSLSTHHLVRIMKKRTRAFFFLRAFPCENKHIRCRIFIPLQTYLDTIMLPTSTMY